VANQRLELLRRRDKDKYEAVMWLRENKSKFRHRIYEPMVLEVRIALQQKDTVFTNI
jgi:hypothetical protein